MTLHRALALVALLGGLLAAIGGTPYRAQPLGALELAQWIRDHKTGLRIVDVRGEAAYAEYHVPRSERATWPVTPPEGETLVVIDDSDRAQSLRGRDVYYLRGGVSAWLAEVMSPVKGSELTSYFGGVPRAGGGAAPTPRIIRRRGC